MRKIITLVAGILILVGGLFFFLNNKSVDKVPISEQVVLEKTLNISKEYLAMRYRTDNILLNAKNYPDYQTWNNEMTKVIDSWMVLEKDAVTLENLAREMANQKNDFSFISPALAYDKQEISDIFDKAPAGKKIATLAKHLGVDASRAFKILQQDQAQVEADVWNEAGDTFQKLETSATVIKDGCKVAGFVGSIALTGGTSALAAGSTLAKAAVIVSGADLTLEVTDDAAKIALGNNNKLSAIVNDVRKVTEPISTILTITDIPNNLSKNIDRFNTAMIALDQFRGAAQDGKIIGIELPVYTKEKVAETAQVTVMSKDELEKWLRDNNINSDLDTKESIEEALKIVQEQYAEIKEKAVEITDVKEDLDNVKEGVNTKIEIKKEEPEKETSLDIKNTVVIDNSGTLSIVSPGGKSFAPQSGLSFAVAVSNPENIMVGGRNVPVWCHWNFFMDGKSYSEKINPSIIHSGTINVCEYSTMLVKQKGKLRVEFKLEKGTTSKYSDEKNVQTIDKVQREYIVN